MTLKLWLKCRSYLRGTTVHHDTLTQSGSQMLNSQRKHDESDPILKLRSDSKRSHTARHSIYYGTHNNISQSMSNSNKQRRQQLKEANYLQKVVSINIIYMYKPLGVISEIKSLLISLVIFLISLRDL